MMKYMNVLGKMKKMNGYIVFKKDFSSIAFSYARYTKRIDELTVYGMKKCLTFFSLANKYFSSLGDEEDEPIYT